jgi:lysophospholipase L1-like esterase
MERRGQRLLQRFALLALAALSTALALVLGELAVRAAFPSWAPRTARMTAFWQYHPRYGWGHVPGTSGRFKSVGFDIPVRINSHGFRGRDIPYARNGSSRRVVVLGDSHVWGFGVEEEDTFGRVLERTIADLEVVNLGVSGYSTDQELLLYQDEGYRYSADAVILMVAHNDLWANTRTIESSVYGKPRFLMKGDELVLDNHPVPPPSWLKRTAFDLSARSHLLTRALRVLDRSRRAATRSAQASPADTSMLPPAGAGKGRFPRGRADLMTARLILELQRSVARKQPSAQLLVVFADLRDGLGRDAVEYVRQFGVASVALDGLIDPFNPTWHLPDGLHWTSQAHLKVAEALGEHLRSLFLESNKGE